MIRGRCIYCGRLIATGKRTCKPHSDLPRLDATFRCKPARMQSNA